MLAAWYSVECAWRGQARLVASGRREALRIFLEGRRRAREVPPCLPRLPPRATASRAPLSPPAPFEAHSLFSDRHFFLIPLLQAKADAQVRWAVLNVVTLLRRHEATHDALADAMSRGASVGECIALIEQRLAGSNDI